MKERKLKRKKEVKIALNILLIISIIGLIIWVLVEENKENRIRRKNKNNSILCR